MSYYGTQYSQPGGLRIPPRLIFAALIALFSIGGYYLHWSKNPVTGRTQHIALSEQQEIALGMQSAPEMARQFGGPSRDAAATRRVQEIGARIATHRPEKAFAYPFEYHLLADQRTVNAFALPGGQVFITEALYSRLKTDGQLAGVLGHETGHVLARHSAEQLAKSTLAQGLSGAAGVAASDGYHSGYNAQVIASMVSNTMLLKYSRTDELEADALGVQLMAAAGYDPHAMVGVMKVLEAASGGSGNAPEFSSTHPNPEHRIERIEDEIKKDFPGGMPGGLTP